VQLEPVWNSEFRSYVWHHHDTLQLNVDNAPSLWLLHSVLAWQAGKLKHLPETGRPGSRSFVLPHPHATTFACAAAPAAAVARKTTLKM